MHPAAIHAHKSASGAETTRESRDTGAAASSVPHIRFLAGASCAAWLQAMRCADLLTMHTDLGFRSYSGASRLFVDDTSTQRQLAPLETFGGDSSYGCSIQARRFALAAR